MSSSENGFPYTISVDADAPIDTVWAAWTEEKPYEAWSYSKPGSVSMDPTPNGRYTATVVTPDGQEFPITGRYIEVVEPELLVMGMDTPDGGEEVMRLDVEDLGNGRSRMTISQTCTTQEEHDMAKQGSQMLLDSCSSYVLKI